MRTAGGAHQSQASPVPPRQDVFRGEGVALPQARRLSFRCLTRVALSGITPGEITPSLQHNKLTVGWGGTFQSQTAHCPVRLTLLNTEGVFLLSSGGIIHKITYTSRRVLRQHSGKENATLPKKVSTGHFQTLSTIHYTYESFTLCLIILYIA